ncbi:hypothetical protein SJI45_05460 [Streptomyces sp. S399]|uniref:hypothetical protein n=1 Tax=Streptomyces sp. S399 TaxID=3096009 RepID=UPI002A7ECE7F|nr:hypothetical protein [Streptomyces sp. S399]WPR54884.1 hypothetical protein SJI45_05460 [Streptomyces sp. S399]
MNSAPIRSGPGHSALGGGGTAGSSVGAPSTGEIRSGPSRTPGTSSAERRRTVRAAASVSHAPSGASPIGNSLPRPS